MAPFPRLSVVTVLITVALPVPLGFTTSKVTVYALFLVPPDTVKVIVIVLPRLTGTVGLIVRVYGATASTSGTVARKGLELGLLGGLEREVWLATCVDCVWYLSVVGRGGAG